MPHEFEEHLLSAYLDNELSADERALVEERLKSDPGAQQLLDDLKRVRSLVSTLPRWHGDVKSELTGSPPAMEPVAKPNGEEVAPEQPTTLKPGESDAAITRRQVDYSATSLAESRLRRHDLASEVRTRQSMRWTTIVAVAAGLATLMLGTPYLLRDWGPKTEVAQHSDFASPPAASKSAPEPAPESAPGSAPVESKSNAPRGWADDLSSLERAKAAEQKRPQTAATDHDAYSLEQGAAETAGNAYFGDRSQAPSPGESTRRLGRGMQPPALEPRAKRTSGEAEQRGRADASGGVAQSEGSEPALSFALNHPSNEPRSAAAPAAPAAPEAAAPPAGREPSQPRFRQDARSYEGLARGGAVPAPQGPAVLAPLSQSLDAAKAIAAGQLQGSPVAPALPQIMTARSEAWNDAEVEAAMTRVWFFVSPGATADSAVALQTTPEQPTSGMGIYSFGARADQPTGQPDANYAYRAQPADEKKAAAGAPADRELNATPSENAAALSKAQAAGSGGLAAGGYSGSVAASKPRTSLQLPPIGLARLPADENASAWLQRLEQERALKPVERLSEAESLAAKSAEPARQATLGLDAGSKQPAASQTKTIVLFVTASEAQQILQSLKQEKQADKRETPRLNKQDQQAAKDRAGAALGDVAEAPKEVAADEAVSQLPSAWWTRPQAEFESQTADAKTAGEEKVILILNQVPRG